MRSWSRPLMANIWAAAHEMATTIQLAGREKLKLRKASSPAAARAWIGVERAALVHNAAVLASILPAQTAIMAVIKANAYGHGDVEVARVLQRAGIRDFAVACAEEGIRLRRHHIQGNILVLGYTPPSEAPLLAKHRLQQAVVDSSYAAALSETGYKLRVQLKIDTGMNRLGEPYSRIAAIAKMFELPGLTVEGVFSHLSASDSAAGEDINFSKQQISRFHHVIERLKQLGHEVRASHIQSSFGALNYPGLALSHARAGLALYGALPEGRLGSASPAALQLRPALSVHASIALVKEVQAGQTIGYGHHFTAPAAMRIAIVAIGYADGIPRSLCGGAAIIDGMRAPIIGAICMDQLALDVSAIPDVQAGMKATFIGENNGASITADEVAKQAGTIPNELLSRLGNRLERRYM